MKSYICVFCLFLCAIHVWCDCELYLHPHVKSSAGKNGTSIPEGEEVNFYCESAFFHADGDDSRICKNDGLFSGDPYYCWSCVEVQGCENWPDFNGVYLNDDNLPVCHLKEVPMPNPESIPRFRSQTNDDYFLLYSAVVQLFFGVRELHVNDTGLNDTNLDTGPDPYCDHDPTSILGENVVALMIAAGARVPYSDQEGSWLEMNAAVTGWTSYSRITVSTSQKCVKSYCEAPTFGEGVEVLSQTFGAQTETFVPGIFPSFRVLTLGCAKGYEKEGGEDTIKCQLNGNVSGTPLFCKLINCTLPELGKGVLLAVEAEVADAYPYNTSLQLDCKYAYRKNLSADYSITCEANRNFSGVETACVSLLEDCGPLEPPPNALMQLNETDATATFWCAEGYMSASDGGPVQRVCHENGTWTGPQAVCTPPPTTSDSDNEARSGGENQIIEKSTSLQMGQIAAYAGGAVSAICLVIFIVVGLYIYKKKMLTLVSVMSDQASSWKPSFRMVYRPNSGDATVPPEQDAFQVDGGDAPQNPLVPPTPAEDNIQTISTNYYDYMIEWHDPLKEPTEISS